MGAPVLYTAYGSAKYVAFKAGTVLFGFRELLNTEITVKYCNILTICIEPSLLRIRKPSAPRCIPRPVASRRQP